MAAWVLRECPTLAPDIEGGDYIQWIDPDAFRGVGACGLTPDIAKAKRFDSMSAALDCWQTQSRVRPYRADGQPNRPLTALSVSPVRVET